MILRSLNKHIKEQNWFAVFLDFFIVVLGILLAFQVTNWNEERKAKFAEQAVINQLGLEFASIKTQLEKQIEVREQWIELIAKLIQTLDGELAEDPTLIKSALDATTAAGRVPAQSAAYIQLTSSGDLSQLSNEALRHALVTYDTRLKRDAFLFPELMSLVAQELQNPGRDINVLGRSRGSATIDEKSEQISLPSSVLSYDLMTLQQYVPRYEAMYTYHISLVAVDEVQLELADKVLEMIADPN
jgi:hypothetical protein